MKLQLANFSDLTAAKLGVLAPEKVRRVEIEGVVDTGATWMVLPTKIADQLGLPPHGTNTVQYADGRREVKTTVDDIDLTVCGRRGIFKATLEPNRETALVGAIVMEDLDLLVDCKNGELRPRDPNGFVCEIG